jgi:hypothetical protein
VTTTTAPVAGELWNALPGWGIAANLTPPELLSSHRLARLRQRLLLAACLVALLTAAGYGYAYVQVGRAENGLSSAQSQTTQLRRQASTYSGITELRGTVEQVHAQLVTLMAGDVEVATLVAKIQHARPPGVAISQLSVTFADGATTGSAATGSLDTSGHAHIGTVELVGTGTRIDDVATFVVALAALPGVVDVLPTSNTAQAIGTQFNLSLSMTDQLLSGRFATATRGTK